MQGIQQWYLTNYPSDALGYDINEHATFYDLYTGIMHGYDIYSFIGVSDSVVRERVFLQLSKNYNTNFNAIYETWINNLK